MARGLPQKKEKDARESWLKQAIANDDVDELHNLIVEERELLDRVSKHPFPNTPLHIAAAAGKTNVAMEMAILKPSFARKLNPKGYSPMHLALQHEHYHTVRTLMTLDPKLIRVQGRCGITPLHFVAGEKRDKEEDNVELLELLAEFLSACKSSIEDLTSQFYLTEILNWKDKNGNTVLHIAVSEDHPQIIKLLRGSIKLNAKNYQDKMALEIYQPNRSGNQDLAKELRSRDPNHSLSQFLRRKLTYHENFVFKYGLRDESIRDIILLVATLITTATYQAAFSPPGGYWGDNSSNSRAKSTVFMALNSSVFVLSIVTICWTAAPLLPHSNLVYSLTLYVGVVYFATLFTELPKSDEFAGYAITALLFVVMLLSWAFPTKKWRNYDRLVRGIDSPGRQIGNFLELKNRK
ncbi:hypothetical protein EUGRSUZ_L00132 [Eucalyptus grandis]|uniref:Uncharacterized protein n=2 Tax=Eucalyptus grandis TaxID=71139 RepID=A0ACC3L6F0_EUCGR|nr:hypothetical protein EUGRSUZ_L00132 [Eucalyptus grandis]